jgi:hypothetical protein
VNELTNKKAACARLVQQLDLGKVQNKYNHRAQRPVDAFLSELLEASCKMGIICSFKQQGALIL